VLSRCAARCKSSATRTGLTVADLRYDEASDSYHVESVNITNGSPADPRPNGALSDDDILESHMRQRYPLLCERFLDGYTEAQVARGHHMSSEKCRIELDIELYSAKRDPLTQSGPGHSVLVLAADSKTVH
jgi:hypothetical protein